MNLQKKLAQWLEAGAIDQETLARISAFERGKERPILLYTLGGLGTLTIAIGLVSLVAANWDALGRGEKLAADLVIGAGLAAALYIAVTRDKAWQSDLLAGVYHGFTLASIALLGQLYQLGTPQYQGLLLWSLSTLPLLLLVRGRLIGMVWLLGLLWTHGESTVALLEYLDDSTSWRDPVINGLAVDIAFASLLGFMLLARVAWLVRERPQVSAAWSATLWAGTLAAGLGAAFVFYSSLDSEHVLGPTMAISGLFVFALHAQLPRMYPDLSPRARAGMSGLVLFIWLMLALGATYTRGELPALGAIAQVALLGIASFTVLQLGRMGAFNLLTALIGLRILIMYFEVFGSMLDTGLGLITGGMLTLLLAWLWKRKSPELAARLAEGQGGRHAS